ncbi:MAG TPA: hypothetical protein VGW34_12455 [Allosphingosinicella sp.]|nr:hypothetical protein [Allosphingosinicella sp.]
MVRKLVTATACAALCLTSATPALAQNYAFSTFDAPRGATATVNLRIPLGQGYTNAEKPSYGLTLGYGQTVGAQTLDGRTTSREMRFADFRFSGNKMAKAQVMSFDLANLEEDRRMNLTGEGNTLWIVVGLVAAGVAICLLADCFEGDDDDSSSSSSSN